MNKEFLTHYDLSKVELQPKDIFGWRETEYIEGLFFDDDIYNRIRDSILNMPITLIIGNPISGKTRIVFDTLKENKTWNLFIPFKDKTIEQYILPVNIKDIVVLLDDVDDYCYENNNSLNKLLIYIVNNNIKCIITCRKGPEFDRFKKKLVNNIYYRISKNKYHIPRFDKRDELVHNFLLLNKNQFKSDIKNFDGNFGSIVLPLDAMRERFQKLIEDDKKEAIAILLGLKLHFHFFNYEENKSKFDELKIKIFSEKFMNEELSMYEWEEALNELISNETSLNFIDITDKIIIEEAYLDYLTDSNGNSIDVVHNDFRDKRLKTLLDRLYSFEEKKAFGFPTNIHNYNNAINKTESYEVAFDIFKSLPKNIRPNEVTYSLLMKRTKDKETLNKLFEELINKGLSIRFVAESSFVGMFNSFNDLFEALLKLDKTSLLRRNGASNKLIELAKVKPKESLTFLFSKFSIEQIYRNPVYNEICLRCCKDKEDFSTYVEPFIDRVGILDYTLTKNFIKICSSLQQNQIALKLIDEYLKNNKFDYFNEKANCFKDEKPLEALELYLEALKNHIHFSEQVKALNNYAQLVYENELTDKISFTLDIINPFIMQNYSKLDFRNAKYLKQVMLLLEIWQTPTNILLQKIDILLKRPDITKSLFIGIINKIREDDKKEIIKNLFIPQF